MTDAHDHMSDADRRLMDALASLIGPAEASDELIDRSVGLLAWLDVDAELAMLLEAPSEELAGTRGSNGTDADLEFSTDDGSCVVELRVGDDSVHGQILGLRPDAMTARNVNGGGTRIEFDEIGAFETLLPGNGSYRIEIELGRGRHIHTDWFAV